VSDPALLNNYLFMIHCSLFTFPFGAFSFESAEDIRLRSAVRVPPRVRDRMVFDFSKSKTISRAR